MSLPPAATVGELAVEVDIAIPEETAPVHAPAAMAPAAQPAFPELPHGSLPPGQVGAEAPTSDGSGSGVASPDVASSDAASSGPSLGSGIGLDTRTAIDGAAREFLEATASAQAGTDSADDDFGQWDPPGAVPSPGLSAAPVAQPGAQSGVSADLDAAARYPSRPPGAGTLLGLPPPAPPRQGLKTQLGLGPVPAAPPAPNLAAAHDYEEADDAPTRVVDAASMGLVPALRLPALDGEGAASLPPVPLPPVPPAPRAPVFSAREFSPQSSPPQSSLAPVAYAQQPGLVELPARRSSRLGLGVAALALSLAAAVGLFLFMPGLGPAAAGDPGELIVTVAGPGQSAVDMPEVRVDGQLRCQSSPCRVGGLAAGPHFVRVSAPGFKVTTDLAVGIQRGDETVLRVDLVPSAEQPVATKTAASDAPSNSDSRAAGAEDKAPADSEPASADALPKEQVSAKPGGKPAGSLPGSAKPAVPTGSATLRISSIPISNVLVDGRPLGSTPKIVKVSPGTHSVVFVSPTGRKARSVRVAAGQSQVVAVKF